MRTLSRGVAAAVLAVAPLLAVPVSAEASCAEDSGPAGSYVVFVGRAEEERRGYTRLAVEEVWHGPDLAPEVWVLSGQRQLPFPFNLLQVVGSSNDADFVDGHRYVVGASDSFQTGACSSEEVAGATEQAPGRPREPRAPQGAGLEGADPPAGPWQIGLVSGGVVLAVGGLVHWLRRRRRKPLAAVQ